MTSPTHPYRDLQRRAHWRSVSSAEHPLCITDWYTRKFPISDLRIGTAGSCFAQHIGRQLRARGFKYVDVEPAPNLLQPARHGAYGYGIYSGRYGNIYTPRQLLQLLLRSLGEFESVEQAWLHQGGHVDPFRPTIEPQPLTAHEVLEHRTYHLARVKKLFQSIDVFVFTLGLTECWMDTRDGAVYPVAPGVSGGRYDPAVHRFVNFKTSEVRADLEAFIDRVRVINPTIRFILTVSPVPLMATAGDQHVAVATMYSKSVLRAVAGELAQDRDYVDYFPSYEIIASHFMRGQFYNSDLRTIHQLGVDHVMKQFFAEHVPPAAAEQVVQSQSTEGSVDAVCDEELLSTFGE